MDFIQFTMSSRMIRQNACHRRTWNLFDYPEACWQPFHTCCGNQSGEDAFQLPEAEAQVPCLTWISCLSAPFSNRWMDRQPLNHNTKQDGISGFVSGNYISLQNRRLTRGGPIFSIIPLKSRPIKVIAPLNSRSSTAWPRFIYILRL